MRKQAAEMRGLCPCAPALVLAAALVVMSSCCDVADGVRTTPNASGDSAADTSRFEGSTATERGTKTNNDGYMSNQATAMLNGISKPVAAEEESLLARQRSASGSRLPDCGHACGACFPCRRVMVSFMCAESASESCPIAYRCMCRGRFFRVPSL